MSVPARPQVRSQFRKIFTQMGFEEMPTNNYVENSFWNFDALFQPQQHPARDAHDTFFLTSAHKAELCCRWLATSGLCGGYEARALCRIKMREPCFVNASRPLKSNPCWPCRAGDDADQEAAGSLCGAGAAHA